MFISHARKKVLLSIFIATFLATPTISYGVDDANNPAIISGTNSGSVTEDINPDDDGMLKVSGVLTITDPDPGEAVFKAASSTGDYGSLIINSAGNWRYAASNNQSIIQNLSSTSYLVEFFAIHSADNTTRYVIITINGADETNSPAIISGTYFGIMTEDINPDDDGMLKVSGALTITDPDPGEAVFNSRQHHG
jgi:VCBS repeat-containing protein